MFKVGDILRHSETGEKLAKVTRNWGSGPFLVVSVDEYGCQLTVVPMGYEFNAKLTYSTFNARPCCHWIDATMKLDPFLNAVTEAANS